MTATTHTQTHSSRATPTVQARHACNSPWSTTPYLDIGIATHHNQLDLMQQPPVVTSKMCLRNPRNILMMATLTEPLTETLTLNRTLTQIQIQILSPNLTLNPNTTKET